MGGKSAHIFKYYDLDDDAQVNAAASSIKTITPPAGYIGRLVTIWWSIPVIPAATGNHYVGAWTADFGTQGYNCLTEVGVDGALIYLTADDYTIDDHANLYFTPDHILTLGYLNGSDTNQTGNRELKALVEFIQAVSE